MLYVFLLIKLYVRVQRFQYVTDQRISILISRVRYFFPYNVIYKSYVFMLKNSIIIYYNYSLYDTVVVKKSIYVYKRDYVVLVNL